MTGTTAEKARAQRHHAVVHPARLVTGANNWAASHLAAIYGTAVTIWVFTAYSVLSGLAKGNLQVTLLTWSNGVQLVFCAVMTYVGNQLGKGQAAKADADHQSLTHIATMVDQIDQHLTGQRHPAAPPDTESEAL